MSQIMGLICGEGLFVFRANTEWIFRFISCGVKLLTSEANETVFLLTWYSPA